VRYVEITGCRTSHKLRQVSASAGARANAGDPSGIVAARRAEKPTSVWCRSVPTRGSNAWAADCALIC
jgi:hypothetical protein